MAALAAKVVKVPAASLHVSTPTWWLTSRFHFSFADYYDTKRSNFGVLRVVNDDLVKGNAGFGTHPHRDAEIFSYIVDGELSHRDSMGNQEALPRGCVQYLSAGTGITHSEMNAGSETCRFLQLWVSPDRKGHTPQYGSTTYTKDDRHNKLLHILGGTGRIPNWSPMNGPSAIQLHQDTNVLVSESDASTSFDLELGKSRQAYLICIEGSLEANGEPLVERDGAQLVGSATEPTKLKLTAGSPGTHFLMVEMPLSL